MYPTVPSAVHTFAQPLSCSSTSTSTPFATVPIFVDEALGAERIFTETLTFTTMAHFLRCTGTLSSG